MTPKVKAVLDEINDILRAADLSLSSYEEIAFDDGFEPLKAEDNTKAACIATSEEELRVAWRQRHKHRRRYGHDDEVRRALASVRYWRGLPPSKASIRFQREQWEQSQRELVNGVEAAREELLRENPDLYAQLFRRF